MNRAEIHAVRVTLGLVREQFAATLCQAEYLRSAISTIEEEIRRVERRKNIRAAVALQGAKEKA